MHEHIVFEHDEDGADVHHVAHQGDEEHYTFESIRLRRKIRRNSTIQNLQEQLWNVVEMKDKRTRHGSIGKAPFCTLMVKLTALIVPPPLDMEEVLQNAVADWDKDSGEDNMMDEAEFYNSIFELVDIWTVTVDVHEYIELYELIIEELTILDENGLLHWKDTSNIKFNKRFLDEGDSMPADNQVLNDTGTALAPFGFTKGLLFKYFGEEGLLMDEGGPHVTKVTDQADARDSRVTILSITVLHIRIAQIYQAKACSDRVLDDMLKADGLSKKERRVLNEQRRIDEFILTYFMTMHGTKRLARRHLRNLIASVERYRDEYARVEIFANLSGIQLENRQPSWRGATFRPFLFSEYMTPLLCGVFSSERKIAHELGSDSKKEIGSTSKNMVLKNAFLEAALAHVKHAPRDCPAFVDFELTINKVGLGLA